MQRYFFDLFNDVATKDCEGSCEGSCLADNDAALERARQYVLEMAADSVKQHGHFVLSHRIVVRSENGQEFTVRFGDVISIQD